MEEMIEKAKEELQTLELLHPHKFSHLKLELQSFISLLHSQLLSHSLPSSSSTTTQASTSMKRKRVWSKKIGKEEEESKKEEKGKKRKGRDRVDVVLDKAHACLRKIQAFKNSTSSSFVLKY